MAFVVIMFTGVKAAETLNPKPKIKMEKKNNPVTYPYTAGRHYVLIPESSTLPSPVGTWSPSAYHGCLWLFCAVEG